MEDATPSGSPSPRLPRGVFWRELSAGDPVGGPLASKAYRTWRYPDGIASYALASAEPALQRETVIYWFLLNCRPYDPADDPPMLAHVPGGLGRLSLGPKPESGGFGSGPFPGGGFGGSLEPFDDDELGDPPLTPGPFGSIYPIAIEFRDSLPNELLSAIANEFPGDWVWSPPIRPSEALGVVALGDQLKRADLGAVLAEVEAAVDALKPAYGGVGHNSWADDAPFSEAEEDALLLDLRQMREISAAASASRLSDLWQKIAPSLAKLAVWAGARATVMVDEGLKRGIQLLFLMAAAKVIAGTPTIADILKTLVD